jgi:hypothetical protein
MHKHLTPLTRARTRIMPEDDERTLYPVNEHLRGRRRFRLQRFNVT